MAAVTSSKAGADSAGAGEGSGLDLFGILQAVAASADKGKPMSIDDVVAQYGDDAAKRAHAERKRAADPSQASAAGDPGNAGGAASLAAEAAQGGAAGGGDGEDGGGGDDEDDEPVDEIEGGGEAMPEDKAGAAALWSQPLVQASKVKEAYVLFAGGRAAGKSSLVATFLGTGRPDSSASSSALEYAFGRKSGASARDAAKVVAHCWELAGGTKLRTLTQVPLTTQRLPNATIVLTASLASPAAVLPLLLRWLPLLRARCAECVAKLRRKSSRHATALEARALKRVVGDGHPDASLLSPLPCHILIVLTHYDKFQDSDPARRRALLQACRYVAHVHGASLLCCSTADRALTSAFRGAIAAAVFGSEGRRPVQLDPASALLVPAGADRLADIGLPRGCVAPTSASAALDVCPQWLPVVDTVYPRLGTAAAASLEAVDEGLSTEDFGSWSPQAKGGLDARPDGDDPTDAMMAGYEEPTVDAARARRLEDLARYVKDAERRLRLNAQRAAPGAVSSAQPAAASAAGASAGGSRSRRAAGGTASGRARHA
ncbi:hypothetical protein FNF27_08064 [Cafeteria roenbergensis]|uniref:Cytoplasmic dynein 2 light intermediate chain 1 n=1 Tax=Cafeteria roenbergensis TaxID=33653 RepID=A0A5A8DCJ6_CAFRO|nr:hypothetical protein FNF27_08064 [Cafeteria roenbergensis]